MTHWHFSNPDCAFLCAQLCISPSKLHITLPFVHCSKHDLSQMIFAAHKWPMKDFSKSAANFIVIAGARTGSNLPCHLWRAIRRNDGQVVDAWTGFCHFVKVFVRNARTWRFSHWFCWWCQLENLTMAQVFIRPVHEKEKNGHCVSQRKNQNWWKEGDVFPRVFIGEGCHQLCCNSMPKKSAKGQNC